MFQFEQSRELNTLKIPALDSAVAHKIILKWLLINLPILLELGSEAKIRLGDAWEIKRATTSDKKKVDPEGMPFVAKCEALPGLKKVLSPGRAAF